MKDDRLYLIHVGECISRIEDYTAEGKEQFLADTKTQDAVLHNLQLLAESTQRLSPDLKEQHPEVDWRGIAGFRNVLVHEYLGVNLVRVWQIVKADLPDLKKRMQDILASLPHEGEGGSAAT